LNESSRFWRLFEHLHRVVYPDRFLWVCIDSVYALLSLPNREKAGASLAFHEAECQAPSKHLSPSLWLA